MATADLLSMDNKKSADKQKALDSALAQIERQFGKGSIMKLGDGNPLNEIEASSTSGSAPKAASGTCSCAATLGAENARENAANAAAKCENTFIRPPENVR